MAASKILELTVMLPTCLLCHHEVGFASLVDNIAVHSDLSGRSQITSTMERAVR